MTELPDACELSATPIAGDELLLVVPRRHRLAKAVDVSVAQLNGETLMGRKRGSGIQKVWSN